MKKNKKLYVKILLVIVISVSCNKNSSELSDITIKNKFQKAKIEFEKAKDIYDNYTLKQAAVIFKKVEKLKSNLTFYQSKLERFKDHEGLEWTGYDYYAKKN